MCGFIQRVTDSPAVIALLEQIGLGDVVPSFQQEKEGILNFYPAFGKILTDRLRMSSSARTKQLMLPGGMTARKAVTVSTWEEEPLSMRETWIVLTGKAR